MSSSDGVANYSAAAAAAGGGRSSNFRYLIIHPKNGGIRDLASLLFDDGNGTKRREKNKRYNKFFEISDGDVLDEMFQLGIFEDKDDGGDGGGTAGSSTAALKWKWVIFVSIVVRKMVALFRKPMEWIGFLVEFLLNLISNNNGVVALLYTLFRGKVVMPEKGSETFISAIGHLDGRINLYNDKTIREAIDESVSKDLAAEVQRGSKTLMDLCIMASKLAYENTKVVQNVVNLHWKMHFVAFYNCWNEYQKDNSTQVFIMCDKPTDASLILVSFRGTEPFDADDWSTDFDYSWYEIPGLGKVHLGFLEALGLGNRMNVSSFQENLTAMNGVRSEKPSRDEKNLVQEPVMGEQTAYYTVRNTLKKLLDEHKNAQFVVTGHSLGGALAILLPTVLELHKEDDILNRLLAVYTFGQPRIGNRQLVKFMESSRMHNPVPKYFRVVYCNDMVPRLPYDDETFLYKHFGECIYYNSFYVEQKIDEEPNRNYFGMRYFVPLYLNALWELLRSLLSGYTYGPEYKETWESTLLRVAGLVIPGLSAHSPVDYVNSVRIGRERTPDEFVVS